MYYGWTEGYETQIPKGSVRQLDGVVSIRSMKYEEIEKWSNEYYAVESYTHLWRDKVIGYLNGKWGLGMHKSFEGERWLETVRHTMVFGGDDGEVFIPDELVGVFVDDDDYEHFWDCTDVCSRSTLLSIHDYNVDAYDTEMNEEGIG